MTQQLYRAPIQFFDQNHYPGIEINAGTGNPNGVESALPGSIWLSTSGSVYVKSSGTGNTGWTLLGSGGGGSTAWNDITGKPTTLSGYGITDAVTSNTDQTVTGAKTFLASSSSVTPIIARGASGQHVNLQNWQNANGSTLASIGFGGMFSTVSTIACATLSISYDNGSTGAKLQPDNQAVENTLLTIPSANGGVVMIEKCPPTVGISDDQNDMRMEFRGNMLTISPSQNVSITGFMLDDISGGGTGSWAKEAFLLNSQESDSFEITLKHLDNASETANQIICPRGVDLVIQVGQFIRIIYDTNVLKWRASNVLND